MSTKHRDELAQRVLHLTEMAPMQGDLAAEGLRNLRVYAELADLEAANDRQNEAHAATSITETLGQCGVVLSG